MVRVYRTLSEIVPEAGPCAVTIGNFDGVHAGHRRILRRVVDLGQKNNWKPSALTFHPHPATVVAPGRAPRLLTTPEQRVRLMAQEDIEQVFVLPFDRKFSSLAPEQFVDEILVNRLQARAILVGENFRFGNKQAGDTRLLRKLGESNGFVTEIISGVARRGRMVSSSEIRRLIDAGAVSTACRLLERPYSIEGSVVHGHGIGSKQTVPTLNLDTAAEILPAFGVYITQTEDLDDDRKSPSIRKWPSITNIGYRPTFDGDRLTIETFLLAPLEGATPERIRVEFLRRVREERKFASPELLKAQILRDVERAQSYFRRRRLYLKKPTKSEGVNE
ncbi:MAG: bifunctional riboflavin kinase/FAD synthetase [Bryobacteraceae bacterium]